jgi:hypothetical protein
LAKDFEWSGHKSILIGSHIESGMFQFGARIVMEVFSFKMSKHGVNAKYVPIMFVVVEEETAKGIGAGFEEEILLITCQDPRDRDNQWIQCRSQQGSKSPGRNQEGRNGQCR